VSRGIERHSPSSAPRPTRFCFPEKSRSPSRRLRSVVAHVSRSALMVCTSGLWYQRSQQKHSHAIDHVDRLQTLFSREKYGTPASRQDVKSSDGVQFFLRGSIAPGQLVRVPFRDVRRLKTAFQSARGAGSTPLPLCDRHALSLLDLFARVSEAGGQQHYGPPRAPAKAVVSRIPHSLSRPRTARAPFAHKALQSSPDPAPRRHLSALCRTQASRRRSVQCPAPHNHINCHSAPVLMGCVMSVLPLLRFVRLYWQANSCRGLILRRSHTYIHKEIIASPRETRFPPDL